jgi:hypothetical protein
MAAPKDDPSIADDAVIMCGIKPSELAFDIDGNPVFSDGAFRSHKLSAFRADRATAADVFAEYPAASRIACLTARDIRNAGCIIDTNEPPRGHVCIYRKDRPGQRISGGAAGQMAKKTRLLS